jgi:hypothetical protein
VAVRLHKGNAPSRCRCIRAGFLGKVRDPQPRPPKFIEVPRYVRRTNIPLGFNADIVGTFIKQTALNPALTGPLLLAAHYTLQGQSLASDHPVLLKRLKFLLYLGLVRVVNRVLNQRALNNAVKDKFDWAKEVAVVTGGSDGIGKQVVLLLAEAGVRVAVLDVQPLTYSGTLSHKFGFWRGRTERIKMDTLRD